MTLNEEHELKLQRKLLIYFSDSQKLFKSHKGDQIQILSIGSINKFAGPDFLDSAIIINGELKLGDIEYDKKSSFWYQHKHDKNPLFENVILQISNLINQQLSIPQIQVDITELSEINLNKNLNKSFDDLQYYALIRLLRKTAQVKSILKSVNAEYAMLRLLDVFYERFSRRSRRTFFQKKLQSGINFIKQNEIKGLIKSYESKNDFSIQDYYENFISNKELRLGKHLKTEIFVNCILPSILAISDENKKVRVLRWYWNEKARAIYGILKSRFPDFSQTYIWQQQGLLEFLNNFELNKVKEFESEYSVSEIIDFYRQVV